jgi:hypothetical protein
MARELRSVDGTHEFDGVEQSGHLFSTPCAEETLHF